MLYECQGYVENHTIVWVEQKQTFISVMLTKKDNSETSGGIKVALCTGLTFENKEKVVLKHLCLV